MLNPKKPGKVRIVFDGAARFKDTSLNDHLLHGPNLMNDLVFHQVRVVDEDTDALRFLWWSEDLDRPPDEYKMLVHIFGAASSPCCANKALKTTASDNADKYHPEVIHTAQREFYVDDLLTSVPTVDKAVWLAEQSRALLKGSD